VERLKTRETVRQLISWMEAAFPDVVRCWTLLFSWLLASLWRRAIVSKVIDGGNRKGCPRVLHDVTDFWEEGKNCFDTVINFPLCDDFTDVRLRSKNFIWPLSEVVNT
jgi:hypothetical protein